MSNKWFSSQKNKPNPIIGRFILCLGCFIFLSLPIIAKAQTVSLSPSSITVGQNQWFSIDVNVSGANNLFTIGFDLLFNPALLQFVGATDGGFLSQNGVATLLLVDENPRGDLVFSNARLGAYNGGVSGAGTSAHLTFKSLAQDGQTALTFTGGSLCVLVNGGCSYAAGSWNNGVVIIYTPDTTPPTTPAGLIATAVSSTQINLSWSASSDNVGVSGYRIYRNSSLVAAVGATSFQDTGLNPATTYSYTVLAFDAAGNQSAQSAAASATTLTAPDTAAPSVPTNLTATVVSSSQINLSWSASSDNVGVSGYRIYRNNSLLTTVNTAAYQSAGLMPSTLYSYQVSGIDAAGNESARSAGVIAITQASPDIIAPVVTINFPTANSTYSTASSAINLSGTATDNVAVINYSISISDGWSDAVVIAPSASTNWSFNFNNLMFGINVITISASDAAGNVGRDVLIVTYNAPDTIAPSIPTNFHLVSATASQLNFAWSASSDDVGVSGYRIYRDGAQIAAVNLTSYSNTGLYASTTYSYRVAAIDAAGNQSAQSVAATATTLSAPDTGAPTTPTNLRATVISSSRIDLDWNPSTDNVFVMGYRIFRNNIQITTTFYTSYHNTGLQPATAYTYRVAAIDAAYNQSPLSTAVQATTRSLNETVPPSVPTNLTATAVSPYQVNLTWSSSADASGVEGYKIYRGGGLIASTTSTSYQNLNLTPATGYSYRVAAYDIYNNTSAQSAAASVTTPNTPDTTAPSVPTNPKITQNSYYPNRVTFSWYRSSDDRAGTIKYEIYRNGAKVNTTTGTSFYETVSNFGAYHYKVRAFDAAENYSGYTNEVSIIYSPDTTPPSAPTNLTITQDRYYPNRIRLSWYRSSDDRAGTIKYEVYRNGAKVNTTTGTSFYETVSNFGTYYYKVRAFDAAGNISGYTNEVSVTYSPDTIAPSVPTNLTATQDRYYPNRVRVSWYRSTDDRAGVINYKVYKNGEIVKTTTSTGFYEVLANHGLYNYQVSAIDAAGNESGISQAVSVVY